MNRFLSILLLCPFMVGCYNSNDNERQPFRVVVDVAAPSSFMIGGEKYGYGYEIMGEYVKTLGREFVLEDKYSFSAAENALSLERADAVITLQKSVDDKKYALKTLFTTNYIVLTPRKYATKYRALRDGLTDLVVGNASVMLAAGFDKTLSYSPLLDSLRSAHIYSSSCDIYQLAEETAAGSYNLLVCERSQAMLLLYINTDLVQVYEFAERVSVNLMYRYGSGSMKQFEGWFESFRQSSDFRSLTSTYMNYGLGRRLRQINRANRVVDGISVWDDIIRQVGVREGIDWRLLSAIAYRESRFKNDIVSPKGAVGIMQIMPVVATHFRFGVSQLSNPDVNVTIAARLIKSINKELKFSADASEHDRLAIMLSAYNCGVGKVRSIRKQIVEKGENPDSWEIVESHLIENGTKVGGYVDDVLKRYEKYRSTIKG